MLYWWRKCIEPRPINLTQKVPVPGHVDRITELTMMQNEELHPLHERK